MYEFRPTDHPATPGVYLMKDGRGRVLYVGKAKRLRTRLASYFRAGAELTPKTRAMVAKVARVDTLSTATEKEALLLEDSLIKKHRPRYNIVLRDDKRYILFRLSLSDPWPRLTITRRVSRDGSAHFGPFTSGLAAKHTWKLLGRVFPLRKCGDATFRNRVRPCLYHHMGQCPAPCVKDVDREAYMELVRQVEMVLSGRSGELVRRLTGEMRRCAETLEYERAAVLRDQIRAVERTVERQAVVDPDGGDMDVAGLTSDGDGLTLAVLFVRQGRLLDSRCFHWPGLDMEDGPSASAAFLMQFYGPTRFIPARVLLPWDLGDPVLAEVLSERRGGRVRLDTPRTGARKQLMEMARTNAREAACRRRGQDSILDLLAKALRLPGPPRRMEAVDISHTGGQSVRAGVAVYEDGSPAPSQYRALTLPGVEGGDDYAALAAWARRRAASGPPWPDLVLVDGGRGQLAAVERALDEADYGEHERPDWRLVSMAKTPTGAKTPSVAKTPPGANTPGRTGADRRAGALDDRVFAPGRTNPLPLRPGSPELLFLQRLRDAAHRHALGRQRSARSGEMLKSELLTLDGVGQGTARLLWDRFGSLEAMGAATEDDLAALPGIGRKRAARLAASLSGLRTGGKKGAKPRKGGP